VFDAVGTLIRVRGSVGTIYAQVAQQAGLSVPAEELEQRFRAAFRRRVAADAERGFRTDADWELARWQAIVAEAFTELPESSAIFPALWRRFACPETWEVFPDVAPALARLAEQGLILAVGSNFDTRLHEVLDGWPELRGLTPRFISAEIGWSKPAQEFFTTIADTLRLPPGDLLMVGDHEELDVAPARAAGWQALLLSRGAKPLTSVPTIASLAELPDWLGTRSLN
jgi:putative hydrolase of the HAD superfamily